MLINAHYTVVVLQTEIMFLMYLGFLFSVIIFSCASLWFGVSLN
jgi:hypothetical protein